MRQKALKVYLWLFIAGGSYALWILLTGITLPCFYAQTVGMQCPGCGLTRMFTSMLSLDFLSAFYYNPVMFILFLVWNAIGILCIFERGQGFLRPNMLWVLFWLSVSAALLFGFLRNFI